jgi:TatA/E family protein of Tat protein translocase
MTGGLEIALVVGIVVLLFGAGRAVTLARSIGEGLRELREVRNAASEPGKALMKAVQDEIQDAVATDAPRARPGRGRRGLPPADA